MDHSPLIWSARTALASSLLWAGAVIALGGGAEFDLSWNSIDCGGAMFSTGGEFQLGATIGQPDATASAEVLGGEFAMTGGFWVANNQTPVDTCPADIAGNNEAVDVDDLLALINAWGACADPDNCSADIAPAGGDDEVDVDDLLAIINAWGACP